MLLFTPDFGSVNSFDSNWANLDTDLWVVSWQGWSSWDDMIEQVTRKVLSLADGVSTVWYGHSMGALVAYEVLKRFETRFQSPGNLTKLPWVSLWMFFFAKTFRYIYGIQAHCTIVIF